jgi:hypothetical protein
MTPKQRAQVNAALVIIHDSGNNAQSVTKAAQALIAKGHPATVAYSTVLTEFSAAFPTLGATMSKVTRLIQASAPESVAQYDKALSEYIKTGSDIGMRALAPMIARDSMALAVKHGEMTEADAAKGDYSAALGAEPTVASRQTFAENTPAAPVADVVAEVGASQISPVAAGGHSGPAAQAAKARSGYTGWTPDAAPAFHGMTPAAVRVAARERASGKSQGFTETPEANAA